MNKVYLRQTELNIELVAIRIVDCGLRKEKGATLKDLYLSDKFTFKDLTFQSVILLLLSRYFRVEFKVVLHYQNPLLKVLINSCFACDMLNNLWVYTTCGNVH